MKSTDRLQHVVLADDDRDHGILFERALHRAAPSITFTQVFDGEALLKYITLYKVDLLFLDLRMPCRNGHECLEAIKTNPALSDIPVIVYSCSCQMTDIQKSFVHQADVYMVKPFSAEHLDRALQSLLAIDWKGDLSVRRHYFINNRFVPFTATG